MATHNPPMGTLMPGRPYRTESNPAPPNPLDKTAILVHLGDGIELYPIPYGCPAKTLFDSFQLKVVNALIGIHICDYYPMRLGYDEDSADNVTLVIRLAIGSPDPLMTELAALKQAWQQEVDCPFFVLLQHNGKDRYSGSFGWSRYGAFHERPLLARIHNSKTREAREDTFKLVRRCWRDRLEDLMMRDILDPRNRGDFFDLLELCCNAASLEDQLTR